MKKALIVFLILAVAGGLFAQTVKVGGSVSLGLGIGLTDEEGDAGKPKVDYVRDRGDQGIRGQVDIVFTSADDAAYGKFGANVSFRAQDNKFDGDTWPWPHNLETAEGRADFVPTANLWWQPNSIVYVQLGSGGPNDYETMAGLNRNLGIGDSQGLKIKLTPIAGLNIGAHAFYGRANKLFENMNYGLGASYTVTGLVKVVGNFRYYAEEKDYSKIQLSAGANFLGLSGLGFTKLAADVGTYSFSKTASSIGIGEAVSFTTGGLTLDASAQQFIWTGDGTKDFIPMRFRGNVAYKVNSIVTVAVQGQYSMGAKPALTNFRNANEIGGVDGVGNFDQKDDAALGISPLVTFSVGPTVALGYNLQKDMSKTLGAKTMTHLIFATVNIGF